MGDKIVMSRRDFKALASETRTKILKCLKERNHNLAELSKKLSLAPPTIKQHLAILETAELIEKIDDQRKWTYYQLTRRSKKVLVEDTPRQLVVLLGITSIILAGLLFSMVLNPVQLMENKTGAEKYPQNRESAFGQAPLRENAESSIPIPPAPPDTPKPCTTGSGKEILVAAALLAALAEGYLICRVIR